MDRAKLLKQTEVFVLDMDGTFYLGDKILDGSLDFLEAVRRSGRRFLFFTNNSSASPDQYLKKLSSMGCRVGRDQLLTSGDVMIHVLKKEYPVKRVYLLGTDALKRSFEQEGILLCEDDPHVVVVGFDMTLTYETLNQACKFIREGAVFLATHPDINCPTSDGFIPDCGAICAAIRLSVKAEPRYVGKPYRETLDLVLSVTGSSPQHTAFVGDRLYTDVAVGVNHGARGFLVLTGEAGLSDVELSEVKPDAVFESLKEMAGLL